MQNGLEIIEITSLCFDTSAHSTLKNQKDCNSTRSESSHVFKQIRLRLYTYMYKEFQKSEQIKRPTKDKTKTKQKTDKDDNAQQ